MRILLTGGGTAGHINPAIAIAEIIKQNERRAEIAFVGTPNGMEARLVREAGYPMYPVKVRGFARSLSPRNLITLYYALTSPRAAKRILADFRPDAVIGTGGYVSWPVLSAAAACGIPCALHESNALPGLTVRRLAPKMDAVWLNFAESAAHPALAGAHTVHTGNPLRRGFFTLARGEARAALGLAEEELLFLSFGGSRGAERINEVCLAAGEEILRRFPHMRHIHACGRAHFDACTARYPSESKRLVRLPYIENMPLYMAAADILLTRAGAMTVSELALCGKCAILVPSPYVADNHQYKNAALLAKAEAAVLLAENDLCTDTLLSALCELAKDPELRRKYEKNIRVFSSPDADRILWGEIRALLRKNRR